MTKTRFSLTLYVDNIVSAEEMADKAISSFLGISTDQVDDTVDMEFVVQTPKPEDDKEYPGEFEVIVFASVKRGSVVNFGKSSK